MPDRFDAHERAEVRARVGNWLIEPGINLYAAKKLGDAMDRIEQLEQEAEESAAGVFELERDHKRVVLAHRKALDRIRVLLDTIACVRTHSDGLARVLDGLAQVLRG